MAPGWSAMVAAMVTSPTGSAAAGGATRAAPTIAAAAPMLMCTAATAGVATTTITTFRATTGAAVITDGPTAVGVLESAGAGGGVERRGTDTTATTSIRTRSMLLQRFGSRTT